MRLFIISFIIVVFLSGSAQAKTDIRSRAESYEAQLAAAAAKYRVDPRLLWTVVFLESRFRPDVVSPKGARGLMQLIPATAARFGVQDSFDSRQNIDGGAHYLRFLLDLFDGDVSLTMAAYNAGEGAVIRYGRHIPPYRETQDYVTAGQFIMARVASAAIFSDELIARCRIAPPVTVNPDRESSQDSQSFYFDNDYNSPSTRAIQLPSSTEIDIAFEKQSPSKSNSSIYFH